VIVVDTNVVVYLLTGGVNGEAAARLLRDDPEWAAPGILLSELQNVLVGLVRAGRLGMDDALAMHADAEDVLHERVVRVDGSAVVEAALACVLSAYDAEFVVLARALGVRLISMDEAILRGAPDVAVSLVVG
jgi:predicted nucleic acid-binding protein